MSQRITQCIIVARRRNDDDEKISERDANYERKIKTRRTLGRNWDAGALTMPIMFFGNLRSLSRKPGCCDDHPNKRHYNRHSDPDAVQSKAEDEPA